MGGKPPSGLGRDALLDFRLEVVLDGEKLLSEWNLSAAFTDEEKGALQGEEKSAFIAAAVSYFGDAPIDHALFYGGDAAWMGLFGLDGKYFKTANTFRAFGKMFDTPRRLATEGADTFGFAAIAGRSSDGNTVQSSSRILDFQRRALAGGPAAIQR